jgi:hypothetical protein
MGTLVCAYPGVNSSPVPDPPGLEATEFTVTTEGAGTTLLGQ